jgi:hypothetical protein
MHCGARSARGIRERTQRTQHIGRPSARTGSADEIEKNPLTSADFTVLIEEEQAQ